MIKVLKNRNNHVQISMMMLAALCSGTAFSRSATLENAELIEVLKPVEISGIKFSCTEKSLPKLNRHMYNYFRELGIGATLVSQQMPDKATLTYPENGSRPLNFLSKAAWIFSFSVFLQFIILVRTLQA